ARAPDRREVDRPGRRVVDADEGRDLLDDGLRRDMPFADGRVEGGDVVVPQLARHLGEGVLAHEALQRQVLPAHRARDGLLALLDRLLAALLREPPADLVARTRALDEPEPVLAGP